MINTIMKKVSNDIKKTSEKISEKKTEQLAEELISSKRIFIVGSGRSRLMASGFAMRLTQLSLDAHVVGEATSPAIEKNDLLIAVSGSGGTETVNDIVKEGKKKGAKLWAITAKGNSKIAKKADKVVIIPAKTKFEHKKSVQPLASLFEQTVMIYFDALIIMLMKKMGEGSVELEKRHTVLE